MDMEIRHKVSVAWGNLKKCSVVWQKYALEAIWVDIQNSGKAEIWSTTKSQERRLEVNEMRMLRWMCGGTKKDNIRNEHVRGSVKVAPKQITEKRLTWYAHVKRRDEGHVLRRMLDAPVLGKRRVKLLKQTYLMVFYFSCQAIPINPKQS